MKAVRGNSTEVRFHVELGLHRRLVTIAREQDRSLASVLRAAARQFAGTAGTMPDSDDLGSISNAARTVGKGKP